ncbi:MULTISPECIES: hypothetical protein [unclassified Rhizobium]|uniref:hypothetical protein n=1 Tax=unclassified Rhizobium TaxID=2613769 RepID=UPI002479C385|nr:MULTISPECIES: hypothetical protein [unclassified Rhizobium]MDH7800745.1 hypothetical protein [Rhizobium sp. AN70]
MSVTKSIGLLAGFALLTFCNGASAAENFLYTSSGELEANQRVLERGDIGGVQIVYNWRKLEPEKGKYDFSVIEKDLAVTDRLKKKLFIQVQDRFFEATARNVPDYLLTDPAYGGGLAPQFDNPGENKPVGDGWVAMQWNPALRDRFQKLLAALAETFDGRVYGVNLPETSIDLATNNPPAGFSCDAYFHAEMENLAFARQAFSKSKVVQYVNFWPCEWDNDHKYMSRLFDYAAKNNVGLGGPDIVPGRKAQMKNSYPFFNQYKGKIDFVGMAVQEPTLTYKNPRTGKPFTKDEFQTFAEDFLGADVIFWSSASPWLKK